MWGEGVLFVSIFSPKIAIFGAFWGWAAIFTGLHVMQTRYCDEISVRPSVRPTVRHTREL